LKLAEVRKAGAELLAMDDGPGDPHAPQGGGAVPAWKRLKMEDASANNGGGDEDAGGGAGGSVSSRDMSAVASAQLSIARVGALMGHPVAANGALRGVYQAIESEEQSLASSTANPEVSGVYNQARCSSLPSNHLPLSTTT
jgi:hypothetical protein